ncbi:GyrI-like domain-containing protein [Eubacterium aggregans]|uniref:GyrI-like domain-containing protein n=1 Tax=Eubacterium aggregans TaxID=81409 RepID=UPI003F41846F
MQNCVAGVDYGDKSTFQWISMICLPDFVTHKDFDWAVQSVQQKKKLDCSGAEYLRVEEGLCAQILRVGPYDDEPSTVAILDAYVAEQGYAGDFSETCRHHEIYLSDARRVAPEKWCTVIRHPITRAVKG